MKLLFVLAVVAAAAWARPADFYDGRFDNFDVKTLVENQRLLKNYANCFIGKGSCTAEGRSIKAILPEAVDSLCGKCSSKQRVLVRTMITAFRSKLPEQWNQLVDTYDPKREREAELNRFLAETD